MAGKADIQAGGAFIRLFVKDETIKGLKAVMSRVATGMTKAVAGLAVAGTAAAAAAVAAAKHFATFGGAIDDMSARTGVARESLAELKFAAEQSGASLDDVETALRFMAKSGANVNDFDKLAAEIAAIADPSERAAKAMEAWGKSGTKLLPMIGQLASLRQEARDLGLVPTEEELKRADAMGDSFDRLRMVVSGAWLKLGAGVSQILIPIVDNITKIIAATSKWVFENEKVSASFKRIGELMANLPVIAFQQKLAALKAAWFETVEKLLSPFLVAGEALGGRLLQALKDQTEEAKREVQRLTEEMLNERGQQRGGQQQQDIPESLKSLFGSKSSSAFSAGGAVALGFGGGGGVAKMTLDEIRALRKAAWEQLRLMREMAARRARPGIFR